MKRTKIIYWIFTGLLAALMLFSGITGILLTPESVELISTHLGYPTYFIPFLGVAKVLGVVALIISRLNSRIIGIASKITALGMLPCV